MDKVRTSSEVLFEKSFSDLQNGYGFCYVFLIAWMWNIDKRVVRFFDFAIVSSKKKPKTNKHTEKISKKNINSIWFFSPTTWLNDKSWEESV